MADNDEQKRTHSGETVVSSKAAEAPRGHAARRIVEKHRRHVELSPGVGVAAQKYGLAVCDDILAELDRTPAAPSERAARNYEPDETEEKNSFIRHFGPEPTSPLDRLIWRDKWLGWKTRAGLSDQEEDRDGKIHDL